MEKKTKINNFLLSHIVFKRDIFLPFCPRLFLFSGNKDNKKNSSVILALRGLFFVYVFELLVRVWFVSIVLDVVVSCLFGCVDSPIRGSTLHIVS